MRLGFGLVEQTRLRTNTREKRKQIKGIGFGSGSCVDLLGRSVRLASFVRAVDSRWFGPGRSVGGHFACAGLIEWSWFLRCERDWGDQILPVRERALEESYEYSERRAGDVTSRFD